MIVELSVIPIGTGQSSIRKYVEASVEEIRRLGLKYESGPMGTSIEMESFDQLAEILRRVHERIVQMGVRRIVTTVRIDDRRDEKLTIEGKKVG